MSAQPGAVADEVAEDHVLVGERIGQAEERDVLANRIVPGHLALIDEDGHRGRGESLGARSDGEKRLRRDGFLRVHVADAVALEIDHLAVADDADRDAGDAPSFERVLHDGVDGAWVEIAGAGERRREQVKSEDGDICVALQYAHGVSHQISACQDSI